MHSILESTAMKEIKVQFSVSVPDDATHKQIEEWIMFELGVRWQLSAGPLSTYDLEAVPGSVSIL